MPAAGIDVTRTLGMECLGFLGALKDYLCGDGETKRTQLALLGSYSNNAGISAGLFRSGFGDAFVERKAAIQDPETGKVQGIILSYLQRCCPSDVTQAATDLVSTQDCDPCTPDAIDEYQEVLIDPSGLRTFCKKVTFQNSQWIQRCEDPEVGMLRRFQTRIDALLCSADVWLLEQIIANAGANNNHLTLAAGTIPDETLIAEYQTIQIVDANRLPVWASVDQIFEDIDCNELNDCPTAILFGLKGGFATYSRAEAFSCCNDAGADVEAVAGALDFAPFKSRHVQTAFENIGLAAADAATATLMIHPGSAHLLEVFKYEHHPFAHGNSLGMVYTDPESGERFDLKVYFDDCNERTIMTLSKHVGVFTAPTDQFQSCDALQNTNGIMLYNFTRG